MLISNQYLGFGGAARYQANAVSFDGSNDYLTRGAGWDGAADDEDGIWSLWFNFKGGNGADLAFLQGTNTTVNIKRDTSNKIKVSLAASGSSLKWVFTSTNSFDTSNNPGWHHLLVAWELDGSPVGQAFLDDVALAKTDNTGPLNGSIDYTDTNHAVGANTSGGIKMNADIADFYYAPTQYLDISQAANRRKFIDSSKKPVDLGPDGSKPTGTQPLLFLSGPTATWHTNLGSGGGLTENGALTDGASSPSD